MVNKDEGISMKRLGMMIYFVTITGCTSTNSLNSEWKESVAQLQITPVMPLRQNLHVGEVYRYLKKPKKYYVDGQIEPTMAFRLEVPDQYLEQGDRVWPSFSFSGGSSSSLGAASKAVAILSANMTTEDTLTLTVSNGYSQRASSSSVIKLLCDVVENNGRKTLIVKTAYQNKIDLISRLRWSVWLSEYKREAIYLRIPTEVYYAKSINVTAKKIMKGGGVIDIPETEQFQNATGNIKVDINSNSTVSLVETFSNPMAIGYRGTLLRVWVDTMEVEEFPEDSGNQFWSDL